ncbi:MAG TPA: site-specific integrase [Candidatus Bathyarchaeia archaeon]|nr:site-specific integrase [Candidatus Bathyarchaeia archaeon]
MKNDNKSPYTINFTDKALTFIGKHIDLNDPEAVKAFIANLDTTNNYKRNLTMSYNRYCKFNGIRWIMPTYEQTPQDIKLPTKEKLLMLIAHAKKTMGLKLTLSMETGLRPVELCRLKVKDFDTEHKTIRPITAKHGNPRTLKVSSELSQRLQQHILLNRLQNDNIFKGDADYYGKYFRQMRNNLAKKLNDPTIRQIRLYDYRHYFCTRKLYDQTNPYTVMVLMGHKSLKTTQKYMHLLTDDDPEWMVESTQYQKRADELIAHNYEYVLTTPDGHMKFRKRK